MSSRRPAPGLRIPGGGGGGGGLKLGRLGNGMEGEGQSAGAEGVIPDLPAPGPVAGGWQKGRGKGPGMAAKGRPAGGRGGTKRGARKAAAPAKAAGTRKARRALPGRERPGAAPRVAAPRAAGGAKAPKFDLKDSNTQSLVGGLAAVALAAGLAASSSGGGGGAAPAKKAPAPKPAAAAKKAPAPEPAASKKEAAKEEAPKVKFTKEYLKASYASAPSTMVRKQQKSTGFAKAAPRPKGQEAKLPAELAAPELVLPLGIILFGWVSVVQAKKSGTPQGTSGFIPGTRPSPNYSGTVKVAPGYPRDSGGPMAALPEKKQEAAPASAGSDAAPSDDDIAARVADAQEWIAAWKKRTG